MNLNIQYNYLKFKLFANTKISHWGSSQPLLVIKVAATSVMCIFLLGKGQ